MLDSNTYLEDRFVAQDDTDKLKLGVMPSTTFIEVDIHITLTKPIKKKIGEIFPSMKEAFRNKRRTYYAKYMTTDDYILCVYYLMLARLNLTKSNRSLLVLRVEN